MAWLAVDKDGRETIFMDRPERRQFYDYWLRDDNNINERVNIPKGTIAKLLGYDLKWEDEPIELK